MHEFIVGSLREGERFGPPSPEPAFDFGAPRSRPEKRFTLQQIAPRKGSRLLYWYDFGDDWYHEIVVTAVGASLPDVQAPHCVDGVGACPPEDCGGPPGYANLLDAFADPAHEEHADIRDWVGDDFDPARFDIDAVNHALTRLATRWKKAPRGRDAPKA